MLDHFLLLVTMAASLNDCGGVGPWCIDARVSPQVADGYVAYMQDKGDEAPGAFHAVLQTGGEGYFSLTVGVWGCDFRSGRHVEGADWSVLAPQVRVQRAQAYFDESLTTAAERCNADPAVFFAERDTFADAYQAFEESRPRFWGGMGAAPRLPGHDLRETMGFGPLSHEGWRFSIQPQRGGPGRVVEASLAPGAEAAQVRMAVATGSQQEGWTPNGQWSFAIPAERYGALADEVDAALAEKEPGFVVCADGPGYLAERRDGAEAAWRAGGCKGGPNDRLAKSILALIRERLPDAP